MNFFKNSIKSLLIFLGYIMLFPFFLTITNLLKLNTNRIIIIITSSILMFIVGYILGKKINKNGYLNGLLLSIICTFIFLLLSLIFRFNLNFNSLLYYLILIVSTIFGSIISINRKIKK